MKIVWSSGMAKFAATESRRLKPSAWNGKIGVCVLGFSKGFQLFIRFTIVFLLQHRSSSYIRWRVSHRLVTVCMVARHTQGWLLVLASHFAETKTRLLPHSHSTHDVLHSHSTLCNHQTLEHDLATPIGFSTTNLYLSQNITS
jgi:hypothetical protein